MNFSLTKETFQFYFSVSYANTFYRYHITFLECAFFEKFDLKMLPCLSLQFIREYTAPWDLCYQVMFEKIRGLQLLVRENEGLDAKQTVPGSNGYYQM